MKSILLEQYQTKIKKELQKELKIANISSVPKIEKICLNIGIGSYLQKLNSKDFSFVEKNLELIAGQKPVLKKAKLSVSNFKLKENQPVGLAVCLRQDVAYNFLYKLINVVFPRVRDFRGINANIFDNAGNCSIGFNDHTVFPEAVVPEDSRKIHGLQVTIITSTNKNEHAKALLSKFGFPFKK